ncbi:PREDICTED: dynein heavy chain 9, axonemal-like [Galeopterus variegatus]|uniref:Dynein heavy chain 9, axonemal-like n=1 Tax=Galeopterus variegatus TaxID=482537 RepID=A0ABM0Q6P8_GALVR|nr:PREDICTED: dynein heavy chain 9, axonemal-like [Galeopterus variegatus]
MSYLESRERKHIPETAAALFSSREFYRQLVANLELMANWYNKVMKTLLEVEFPLVEEELQNIDLCLRAAEETLNWKTEDSRCRTLLSITCSPTSNVLVSVLKEMSYLESRERKHIPETAAALFSSREFYRQLVANLELMANWYNKVMKTLLEVEFPLVEEELQNIDLCLRAAEETLNWKTEGIWDYVIQITNSIHDLEERIQKTKDNVEEIQNIMKAWVTPIFKRKDGKRESLLSLDDQHDQMEKYYSLIKESGLKIHALVQVITNLLDTYTVSIGKASRSIWVQEVI